MATKHKAPLAAILALLEVQTRLQLAAETDPPISPRELRSLVMKLEVARNTLQRTILKAIEILDEGEAA